jgi:hypothetical protein
LTQTPTFGVFTVARFGFLVPAIALLVTGGFYLWKAAQAGFFVGRDRVRAVAGGLCYVASALAFTAAFAQYSAGSVEAGSVGAFFLLAGAVAAPGGSKASKAAAQGE